MSRDRALVVYNKNQTKTLLTMKTSRKVTHLLKNTDQCIRFLLISKSSIPMQYTYSYPSLIHIPISKPIGDENSEHCLWFLLCSKSSMLCSVPIVILYLYIYPYQNLLVMKAQIPVSGFCYAQNRVCYAIYL